MLAVAATLSFAACQREVDIDSPGKIGDNVLAFTLAGGTRAEAEAPAFRTTDKISIGDPIDGQAYFLEESVASLDEAAYISAPETRGTPVYTENFETMSGGKFRGLAFPVETNSWNYQKMKSKPGR